MSSAAEILLRKAEADRWLRQAADAIWREMATPLFVVTYGRLVHSQRARKLRRRGAVVQRVGPGKYRWAPSPFALVLPDR